MFVMPHFNVKIDPSGPLATLRKLLLSTRTISSLAQLLSHYAPLVVASALAMFVLFVLALKLLCSLPPGAASTAGSLYYKQAVTANGTNNTEQVRQCKSKFLFAQPSISRLLLKVNKSSGYIAI